MLTEVGDWLDDVGGRRFLSQTTDKQTECLIKLDKSAFQDDSLPKKAGERAWSEIKPLIVASYYSSEVGASKELVYDPVPGKFENITLTDDYRAQSNEGHGEKW
ncbi:Gluconate 2-dehydrogenase subunit 3 [Novosphingobium mathurense]|uniref:Gluconate 2-dehydrogenase subunit 3 n=2 Tax=Novosphingobium mathurense TaxID=428990 RepID=A0A1U6IXQ0_9SPHN|nr:Gluconate 2-dehydrogenase subunit 3 [Novosphingobium mathurense]